MLARGLSALRVGLGCARFSMSQWAPDEATALATIHAALDAGVRLVDTADSYSDSVDDAGANERLVARALSTWSGDGDEVLVATKGGRWRPPDGSWQRDATPATLRRTCEASLVALGVERIGLYYLHSIDPRVPLAESLGALDELRIEGKITRIGVSNLTADELDEARATIDVSCIQDALSPDALAHLPLAVSCPIPFFAWAPLQGVRTDADASSLPAFVAVADLFELTVRQVALAWMRTLGDQVTPIIGPVRPGELAESLAAPITLPSSAMDLLPGVRSRRRACAVVLRGDDILMVEQTVDGRVFWTLPGGGVDPGETDEEAAVRELREETGLDATAVTWLCDAPGPMFLADVPPTQEPALDELRPDADELTGVAWRPIAEVALDRQVRVVLAALAVRS